MNIDELIDVFLFINNDYQFSLFPFFGETALMVE